jgi:hypothetical protein
MIVHIDLGFFGERMVDDFLDSRSLFRFFEEHGRD